MTTLNALLKKIETPHYSVYGALLSCFYLPFVFLKDKYQQDTVQNVLFKRDFKLSRLFQYSYLGHKFYACLGFKYYFFCYLVLLVSASYIVATQQQFGWLSSCALVLALCVNTVSLYCVFYKSNYNTLGMVLILPVFYLLSIQAYWFACILATIAIIASFSSGIFMLALIGLQVLTKDVYALISSLGIGCVLVWKIAPLLIGEEQKGHLSRILAIIGAVGESKYHRNKAVWSAQFYYWISLNLLFIITYLIHCSVVNYLVFTPLGVSLLNSKIRFADIQHFWMFAIGVYAGILIQDFNSWSLLLFLAIANLPPRFFGDNKFTEMSDCLPVLQVQDFAVFRAVEQFLKSVPENATVFHAHRDPQGMYNRIFQGQKEIVDVIFYAGMQHNVAVYPNYWAVLIDCKQGDLDYFYKDSAELFARLTTFNAEYMIISSVDREHLKDASFLNNRLAILDFKQVDFDACSAIKHRLNELELYKVAL
ncbi:hypothetical protein [Neptunicella marina]|uniref:Uncharacterized protein n=1 Tax=Neptunicella marina TaxID=2125989 RepID=A0A8J6IRD0_9ALTE|nr:hypothetical protein [Neptunicella marina]MBC3765019.1 hypothetical protein [Neptunicella marina]